MEKEIQTVFLEQRESLRISGVLDVDAFDGQGILLETTEGMLHVKGNGLKVQSLSEEKKELEVLGRIDSLAFTRGKGKGKKGGSMLAKMFK